jgi:hypothetical protein
MLAIWCERSVLNVLFRSRALRDWRVRFQAVGDELRASGVYEYRRRGVEDQSTNGTYFSLMPLAIMRFNSARGLVNQPQ